MTSSRTEAVETAKRYPFPRPGYSFLYVDGEALRLLSLDESGPKSQAERLVVGGLAVFERGAHWLKQDLDAAIAPRERSAWSTTTRYSRVSRATTAVTIPANTPVWITSAR